ncbi:tryptophan--tRNA ligase [Patescibacteria group bacterium]|nr:tryptophan--tRNA ligase [Patescibacteria group bacterium]
MAKKRVLSGIRATGRLHLGNYLGAVKGMLALQDDPDYETFYMIADLHTTTTPFEPAELKKGRREVLLDYLAAGLDTEKSAIFAQSDLADLHAQLAFYFSTVVSVARLRHLPTFKDKVKQYPGQVTMALLNYPVLMAADILIYKASKVPVGIDQEPHLEVAREIARKMNSKYNLNFPEPTRFATKGEHIPSLTGKGKMSKSVQGSYLNLTDDLPAIKAKLAKVPTDAGVGDLKYENVPKGAAEKLKYFGVYESKQTKESRGVAVLMLLVEIFQGKERKEEYDKQYEGEGISYQKLKGELAKAIFEEFKPIQKKRKEFEEKPEYVEKVLEKGAKAARKVAEITVREVRDKMGI